MALYHISEHAWPTQDGWLCRSGKGQQGSWVFVVRLAKNVFAMGITRPSCRLEVFSWLLLLGGDYCTTASSNLQFQTTATGGRVWGGWNPDTGSDFLNSQTKVGASGAEKIQMLIFVPDSLSWSGCICAGQYFPLWGLVRLNGRAGVNEEVEHSGDSRFLIWFLQPRSVKHGEQPGGQQGC